MAKGGFTKKNLADDIEDAAAANNVDGLQAHFAAAALGLKQSGISYQRIEPGKRQPWGHRHEVQEEIYVILAGSGIAKLGDDEVEVRPLDAIRVAPGLARNFEAGPDGLDLLAYGSPRDPDDPGGEAEMLPGWWGDEDF